MESGFPELADSPAVVDAAEGEDIFGPRLGPKHAGLLATPANDRLATSLDDARADEVAGLTVSAVLHATHVADEVAQGVFHGEFLWPAGAFLPGFLDQSLDLVFEQAFGPRALPLFVIGMILADEGVENLACMFQRMIEIYDLDAVLEVELAHLFQSSRPVDEQHDLSCRPHSTSHRLLAKGRAKFIDRPKTGEIGGRVPIPHWVTFLIGLVLSENAAQIDLAGFGGAIGLFAPTPFQLRRHHRHAGSVGADIEDRRRTGARLGGPFLPLLGGASHALDHPLNLAGRNDNAASLLQMPLGLQIRGFVRAFQADQPSQSGRVGPFQAQAGISRVVAGVLAGVIVVIPLQGERAEQTLDLDRFPALPFFPRLG